MASTTQFKTPYYKPRTSLGATGHWIKMAAMLAPLAIGEFVKDPDQRWRWIRISAIATTLISEAMWTNKVRRERHEAHEHQNAVVHRQSARILQ